MVLLETIVEIGVVPVPHTAAELYPNGPGTGVVAVCRDPVGSYASDSLC
jgi:hypothetical protein